MFKKSIATDYADKLKTAKFNCVHRALSDIVKMEVKVMDNGKEVISFPQTCSSIKTRARLALDFVANLDKTGDDEN